MMICLTSPLATVRGQDSVDNTSAPTGVIDRGLLDQFPSILTVGNVYSLKVKVTNSGLLAAKYWLNITYPITQTYMLITPQQQEASAWKLPLIVGFTLSPGNSTIIVLNVVPLERQDTPIQISARLFVVSTDLVLSRNPVDTVAITVYRIELTGNEPAVIVSLILLAFSLIAILLYCARKGSRNDFLVSLLLIGCALLLRAINYTRVGALGDEVFFTVASLDVIANHWSWPVYLMQGFPYPPVLIYLYAFVTYLFGYGLQNTRWISILCGSLTPILIYLFGRDLYGRKVGAIAGAAFAFFPEAIITSDTIHAESLTILLIMLAVYTFWRAQSSNSTSLYLASGFIMGLILDVKYEGLVQFTAVLVYYVFIVLYGVKLRKKPWNVPQARQMIAWLGMVIVVVAPVQIDLLLAKVNPYLYYYINQFTIKRQASVYGGLPTRPGGVTNLAFRFFRTYVYETTRSGSPWLPWLPEYVLVACVLLVAVSASYLWVVVADAEPRASYIVLLFAGILPIIFISPVHTYWIIYAIPFFLLMLAYLLVSSIRLIRESSVQLRGIRVYRVVFVGLILFLLLSIVIIGAATPFVDNGDEEAPKLATLYLQHTAPPGSIVATEPLLLYGVSYYANIYDLNITVISMELPAPALGSETQQQALAENLIDPSSFFQSWIVTSQVLELQPRFLVLTSRTLQYNINATIKQWIFGHYRAVAMFSPHVGYQWWGYYWGQDADYGYLSVTVYERF